MFFYLRYLVIPTLTKTYQKNKCYNSCSVFILTFAVYSSSPPLPSFFQIVDMTCDFNIRLLVFDRLFIYLFIYFMLSLYLKKELTEVDIF